MSILTKLGHKNESITYIDRPTVKVIIKKDDDVLILNDGLLPGGGVDEDETNADAIKRELQEELGATVRDIEEIGAVIQYRDFIAKRYIINGYVATLNSIDDTSINPQDLGEAQFIQRWMKINDALNFIAHSIELLKDTPEDSDAKQGKLYNLQTSYNFLKKL